jgi:hypothetical protein
MLLSKILDKKSIDHVWGIFFTLQKQKTQVFPDYPDMFFMRMPARLLTCLMLATFVAHYYLKDYTKPSKTLSSSVAQKTDTLDLERRLHTLHNYYLLLHKYKHTPHTSKIFIIKSKINQIELMLLETNSVALKKAVINYSWRPGSASESMKNLSLKLGIKTGPMRKYASQETVEEEIKMVGETQEFLIVSMNIEHLSHVMKIKLKKHI